VEPAEQEATSATANTRSETMKTVVAPERRQLADELASAGHALPDWRTRTMSELRQRVRELSPVVVPGPPAAFNPLTDYPTS